MNHFEKLFLEKRKNSTGEKITDLLFNDLEKNITPEWVKFQAQAVNYSQNKDFPNALNAINEAIRLKPNHPHLLNIRASIYEDSGNNQAAVNDFKESLSISGDDWYSTYNQIALSFLKLKQFEKSLQAFDIAIELKENLKENDIFPSNIDGVVKKVAAERMYANRANVKLSLKDFDGSLEDCKIAIKLNPQYSTSFFILGLLFIEVEQKSDALQALKAAEQLGHKQATSAINHFFG